MFNNRDEHVISSHINNLMTISKLLIRRFVELMN